GAPLGAILMPPEDGRERAPQILGWGLALGPARLDQRLQPPPLCVRQHHSSSPGKEQNAIPVRRFKVEQALVPRHSEFDWSASDRLPARSGTCLTKQTVKISVPR